MAKTTDSQPQPPVLAVLFQDWRQILPIALVAAAGIALSLAGYLLIREHGREMARTEIERDCENIVNGLQEIIRNNIEGLGAVKSLFSASEHVTPDEFEIFVRDAARMQAGTLALGWIPRVRDAEREAYDEEGARGDRPELPDSRTHRGGFSRRGAVAR